MHIPVISRWKSVIIWLAALFLGVSLAACMQKPAPAGGLTVAVPQGSAAKALQAAALAYQQASGESVRVVALERDFYAGQVSTALLAGLDRYDLVYVDADSLARWVSYHAIQPLDGAVPPATLAAQAMTPWRAAVTVDGRLYGLPTQADALVLWYRADLLAQQHLAAPADWAAFRQAALALNAPPQRYGAAIAGSDQEAGAPFAAVLAGFGAQAVSSAYQVEINSAAARQALAFYAGLRNNDRVVAPRADQLGSDGVVAALGAGQAALGLAPLSAAPQLTDCQASPRVCAAGKPLLAWAWLPGVTATTAVGHLDAWVMPVHAHKAAAERFARWLASEDGARAWAHGGGVPANTRVLAEDWSAAHIPGARALSDLQVFRLAFPPATTIDALWQASHQAVHAAIAGDPPDQALQTAAQQIQQALNQGGY